MRVRSADRKARLRAKLGGRWLVLWVAVGVVLVLGVVAAMSVARDAAASSAGAESAEIRLADRTLVPKRIRLIIGYKRPRLA